MIHDTVRAILDSSKIVKDGSKMYYTGIVKSCTQTDYPPDKFKNVSYSVKFVDQMEGLFSSVVNQNYFVTGQEQSCMLEIKEGGKGQWIKIRRDDRKTKENSPASQPRQGYDGPKALSPDEQQSIINTSSLEIANKVIKLFALTREDISKLLTIEKAGLSHFTKYFISYVNEKAFVDGKFSRSNAIAAQSSLKQAVESKEIEWMNIKTLEQFMALANNNYTFITTNHYDKG